MQLPLPFLEQKLIIEADLTTGDLTISVGVSDDLHASEAPHTHTHTLRMHCCVVVVVMSLHQLTAIRFCIVNN